MKNIVDFIKFYYKENEFFFITCIDNKKGYTSNYLHNISSFEKYLNSIKKENETRSIYYTINSFKSYENCTKNIKNLARKTKENVLNFKSFIFDFDNTETSLEDLTRLLKELKIVPNFVIKTSEKKYQVCFKIKNCLSIEQYENINRTLAKYFKSDENVCSTEKVFRLPFFINQKNGYETKLIFNNNNEYDISYFENFIYNNNIEDINKEDIKENLKSKDFKKNISNFKKEVKYINNIKDIDYNILTAEQKQKAFAKYYNLYKIKQDGSIVDYMYVKNCAKKKDYEQIKLEIFYCRNELNLDIKRDINKRYEVELKEVYLESK